MSPLKKNDNIKGMKELLAALGDHIDSLRPENKPTKELVSAARSTATIINSYIGVVCLGMEYGKMKGQEPDLAFLQITGTETR